MRDAHGYATEFGPSGEFKELDTYQCGHHGGHVHLKPGEAPYGTCKQCMQFICQWCYHDLMRGTGVCKPQEKQLEEMERNINQALERDRRRAEYSRLSGY